MLSRLASALVMLTAGYFIGVYSPHFAAAEPTMVCGAPLTTDKEWPTTSLKNAKFDEQKLCLLIKLLDNNPKMNVHAVVIIRGGNIVFETYRPGNDENWGTKLRNEAHTAQTLHDVRSVSKSVVSLLVGIALDRKLIASVDEPVFSFFPEYSAVRTPEKERIQLRHLLTMTAGLAANEDVPYESSLNTERAIYESSDPYKRVLELQVEQPPGVVWNYNGGCTMLLGAVLQKVTGKSLTEFAKDALFDPLGITSFYWTRVSPSGEPSAGAGLRLRPRDMAKIGQLLINKGVWNGHRVVSQEWIDQSTQPRYPVTWNSNRYGFHWWVGSSNAGKRTVQWVAGWGFGGQRVFVIPDLELVVAINAGLYESGAQSIVPLSILGMVLDAIQI